MPDHRAATSGSLRLSGPPDPDLRVVVSRRSPDGTPAVTTAWNGTSWTAADRTSLLDGTVAFTQVEATRRPRQIPLPHNAASAVLGALVAVVIAILVAQAASLVSIRSVLTGSMEPSIPIGSLVVAVNDELRTPRPGDVVLYQGRRFDGTLVGTFAHRIVGGSREEGWVVKGDANPAPDTQRPYSTDIAAVVVATIPGLGRLASARTLVLALLLAVGTWLLASGLWSR
jgi:signal peptidase